jgi:hypothetical protein
MKPKQKLFIVKKYILATSASDAIRKEKNIKPDDVWVDDDWRKGNKDNLASAIGFEISDDQD